MRPFAQSRECRVNDDIGALERLAAQLASRGDWGLDAEAINRRLVKLAPRRTAAYTRLARCLRERGDVEGAQALYRQVLKLDPNNQIAGNYLNRPRPSASIATKRVDARTAPGTDSNDSQKPARQHRESGIQIHSTATSEALSLLQ